MLSVRLPPELKSRLDRRRLLSLLQSLPVPETARRRISRWIG